MKISENKSKSIKISEFLTIFNEKSSKYMSV